jgi:hypothetical protein
MSIVEDYNHVGRIVFLPEAAPFHRKEELQRMSGQEVILSLRQSYQDFTELLNFEK